MKFRWILLMMGLLVAVGLGLGVGVARMNSAPFFIDLGVGVGGLHAKMYVFQPYYLWGYEREGGEFAKVFYLRNKWMPHITTLWWSGKYKDIDLGAVEKNKIKFGQRIRVTYLSGESLGITGAVENTTGCEKIPRICKVYFYTKDRVDIFFRFSKFGVLAGGQPLPILFMAIDLK